MPSDMDNASVGRVSTDAMDTVNADASSGAAGSVKDAAQDAAKDAVTNKASEAMKGKLSSKGSPSSGAHKGSESVMDTASEGSSATGGKGGAANPLSGDKAGGLKGALKGAVASDAEGGSAASGSSNPVASAGKAVKNAGHGANAGSGAVGLGAISKFVNAMKMGLSGLMTSVTGAASGVMGAINGAIGAVVGFAQAVAGAVVAGVSTVATALGVGMTAAAVMVSGVAVMAVAVIVVPVAVVMSIGAAQYDGTLVDCAEAIENKAGRYGTGDGQIPETIGDFRIGYTTTWEAPYSWMNANIGSGTYQRTIVDMWGSSMGTAADENGFGRINDYYLVAIAPTPFGVTEDKDAQVGQWITFYLDNGFAIECIVADTKGDVSGSRTDGKDGGVYDFRGLTPWDEVVPVMTPTGPATISAYGHTYNNDVNVLEFCGDVSENNHFERLTGETGHRVASFTNHGYAPEYVEWVNGHTGCLGLADDTASQAQARSMRKAKETCVKTFTYDNTSIATAAVSYSWPSKDVSYNNGTDLYQKVITNVSAPEWFMSCDRGVAGAVRWSGSDDDYPIGATDDQFKYAWTSPRWKVVGKMGDMTEEDLLPGDVLITGDGADMNDIGGHTWMYVGEDLVQRVHGDKAVPGSDSVSASLNTRSASCNTDCDYYFSEGGCDPYHGGLPYWVFRCVEPQHSEKYVHAGE